MTRRTYSDDFKEQIVNECEQVGNIALVARRHDISRNTIYYWIKKSKKNGSVKPLPEKKMKKFQEIEKRLQKVSKENHQLKNLLGEKELEFAILRELRDQSNPA